MPTPNAKTPQKLASPKQEANNGRNSSFNNSEKFTFRTWSNSIKLFSLNEN